MKQLINKKSTIAILFACAWALFAMCIFAAVRPIKEAHAEEEEYGTVTIKAHNTKWLGMFVDNIQDWAVFYLGTELLTEAKWKTEMVLLSAAAMLSLALAGSIGATVASADSLSSSGENTGTTTVTYKVESTWQVTIPESIELNADGSETTASVSASDVKIEQDQNLKVTVSSENGWKVQDSEKTNGFEYELTKDGETLDNDSNNTVLEVAAGDATGSQELKAKLKDSTEAGKYSTGGESYTDELTFEVTVS